MFFLISINPSVPRMVSLPSPHVFRPSGVNQSTRIYPEPPLPFNITSPKSSKLGYCLLFTLPTCEATTSPDVEPVKYRNWSNWWEPISVIMPPYLFLSKNHSGRDLGFIL